LTTPAATAERPASARSVAEKATASIRLPR
jgi:hypothetical protein